MRKIKLFEVMGSILLTDNGVENKLTNIDNKAGKTGLSFGKLGKIAIATGVAIMAGFGGALIKGMADATDAEAKVAQLEAVLKSTGGTSGMTKNSLLSLAEGLEKTTKFSAESALEAESLLLTFTKIGKDVFPRATKASADMAQALGTDMKSQSIALGKALQDPIKGVTSLSRVGVTFDAGQKKQIKTMTEAGNVAGAQAIILKELEKEFGGSAEAAGNTFAGKMVILNNAIGAVTENLAVKFIPYLQIFMNWVIANMPTIQAVMQIGFEAIGTILGTLGNIFTTYILPVLKELYNWVIANMPLIQSTMQSGFDIVNVAIKTVVDILAILWNGLVQVGTWMSENQTLVTNFAIVIGSFALAWGLVTGAVALWTWVTTIATAITTGFGVAMAFLTSPIGIVILAIGAVIAVALLLWKNWDSISAFIVNLWNGLKTKATEIFSAIWTTIKSAFSATISWFKNIFASAWNGIKAVFSSVGSFFGGLWNTIKSKFTTIGSAIGNAIGGAFKTVVNSIIGFAENTINGFIRAINGAISLINKIPGVSIGAVSTLSIPHLAKGTDSWDGGIVNVNEIGGEIIDLPKGSRVIPHDVSMEMAKNNGNKSNNQPIIYYLITNLDGKEIARTIVNPMSEELEKKRKNNSLVTGGVY